MSKEQWVDIAGYRGLYQISNDGHIESCRQGRWKRMCFTLTRDGYLRVSLRLDGGRKTYCVHRLVAEAFIGPAPDNYETNHLDGNKLNNAVENLEWVTHTENLAHAERLGLMNRACGAKNGNSKLTVKQVQVIRHTYAQGKKTQAKIATMFGVSQAHVSEIVHCRVWRHIQGSTHKAVVL